MSGCMANGGAAAFAARQAMTLEGAIAEVLDEID